MILLQTQTKDGETIEALWKGETVRICVRILVVFFLIKKYLI